MNKFEHFSYNDLDIRKIEKLNKIKLEFEDSCIDDDGRDYYDYDERVTLDFSGKNARQHCVDVLNAALDACLVQRVVQDEEEIESKYATKKLPDGKVWMMENLREKVEGAVWNEDYNCYMYTFNQAHHAVPEGFHLPSAKEFFNLTLAFGYLEEDEEVVASKLINECNFVLSGYANSIGTLSNQGSYGYYWSSSQNSATYGHHLYLNMSSMNPASYDNKECGMAVRCIKD